MPSWITCLFSAKARAEQREEKRKNDMGIKAMALTMRGDYLGVCRLADAELAKSGDDPQERANWLMTRATANLAMGDRVSCITDVNEVLGMGPGSPLLEMTKATAAEMLKAAGGTA
jgi:hypothetical protein